jgi:branched-chain amino acid transport system permease protein
MLSSIVIGLIVGAGYSLMALGLVLIYKATRRFNFAQGEFGTVATFVAWMLLQAGWPWILAALVAILAGVAMGLVTERVVVRPLMNSPPVTVLVATAGVALFAIALQIIFGEAKLRSIEPMIGGTGFTLAGISVNPQKLLIVLALAAGGAVLYFFFRSPLGTALLATSQEPFAARVVGIDINRMSMLVWGLAALFGAMAGLLFAPLDAFTPGFMTARRLIPGFTAAVIGGMSSLPGAILGGFVVGIVEALFGHYLGGQIAGADFLGVFLALLVVLFIRPQGLLGKEA